MPLSVLLEVGGGTWFEGIGRSIPIGRGHICAHASGVLHGGHPITEGTRYILVAFVIVEPIPATAASWIV